MTCSWESTLRVWDTTNGTSVREINEHTDWVMALAASPEGAKFASAGKDKIANIFSARSLDCIQTINCGSLVWRVAFMTANELIVGLRSEGVFAYDTITGQQISKISSQILPQGIDVSRPIPASRLQSASTSQAHSRKPSIDNGKSGTPARQASGGPSKQSSRRSSVDDRKPAVSRSGSITGYKKRKIVKRTVDLTRGASGFGMKLVSDGSGVFIGEVIAGSVAEASGNIFKGDKLVDINGTDVSSSSQPEVVAILKQTPQVTVTVVGYVQPNVRSVTIARETGQILGMRIAKSQEGMGVRVASLVPGSAAAQTGQILNKDFIIRVNDTEVIGALLSLLNSSLRAGHQIDL